MSEGMEAPQRNINAPDYEANVVAALQLVRNDLESGHEKKANFVRIIMRFPKIRAAFDGMRAAHARYAGNVDGGGGEVVNGGDGNDVDEYIVQRVISLILAGDGGNTNTADGGCGFDVDNNNAAYRRAMMDVVSAYISFDREGKGYFTSEEYRGFMASSKRAEAAESFFTEERWSEIDVDGDGKVGFAEFLSAFSRWVGVGIDDDEDDDGENNVNSRMKNPLAPRVTLALQLSKAILDKQKKEEVNFTRIIMRFPKIHLVFDRIITTFEKYDANKDGRIELSELKEAMMELMSTEDEINLRQVENIFMLSDLDHHGLQEGLAIKEFIVFCAVGFILAETGGKSVKLITGEVSDSDKEYRHAMMDIVRAYLTFDIEGKGYFTSDEMRAAVSDCRKKDAGTLLTPERWRELDKDHSGRVDFEEFVYAFSTWVRAGDDDDE